MLFYGQLLGDADQHGAVENGLRPLVHIADTPPVFFSLKRQTYQTKMDTYTNMYHTIKEMLTVSNEPEKLLQHISAMDNHRAEIIEIYKRNSREYRGPNLVSLLEQNNTKMTKLKI